MSDERQALRLVRVDYETQARTVKASGRWYRDLIMASRRGSPAG